MHVSPSSWSLTFPLWDHEAGSRGSGGVSPRRSRSKLSRRLLSKRRVYFLSCHCVAELGGKRGRGESEGGGWGRGGGAWRGGGGGSLKEREGEGGGMKLVAGDAVSGTAWVRLGVKVASQFLFCWLWVRFWCTGGNTMLKAQLSYHAYHSAECKLEIEIQFASSLSQ